MAVRVQSGHLFGGQKSVDDAHPTGFQDAVIVAVEGRQSGSHRETKLGIASRRYGKGL